MRGAAQIAMSDTATGTASVRSTCLATRTGAWWCRTPWNTSEIAAATASASRNQTVPGTLPVCSSASVRAPKATNSPWGMKMTRVTAKTSTVASARSA